MARRVPSSLRPREVEDEEGLPPEFGEPSAPAARAAYPSAPIRDDNDGQGLTLAGTEIDPSVGDLPFFAANARAGTVARVRVESLDAATSMMQFEGTLPANASESMVINKWARPGTFRLTAVDINNRPVGEPRQIIVSPTNITLIETLRQRNANPATAVTAPSVASDSALQLIEKVLAQQAQREEQILAMAQNERAVAEQLRAEANEKQAAAAAMVAERHVSSMETLFSRQAEFTARQQDAEKARASDMMQALSVQNDLITQRLMTQAALAEKEAALRMAEERARREADIAMARAAHQAEMERIKEDAALARLQKQQELEELRAANNLRIEQERLALQERMAAERQLTEERNRAYREAAEERERLRQEANLERARLDAEREKERERALERERERMLAYEERLEQQRREDRERAKEHNEAMANLNAAKDPIGATIGLLTTVVTAGKKLGIDIPDVLSGLMTAKASGWADVVKEGVSLVKTVVAAGAGVGEEESVDDAEDPNQILRVQLPDGRQVELTRAQYAQLQAQAQARAAQQAQQPQMPPSPVQIPATPQWQNQQAWGSQDQMMQLAMGVAPQLPPQAMPAQGMQGQPAPHFAPPPMPPVDTTAIRQACVRLVDALEAAPRDQWQAITMTWWLQQDANAVYEYMKQVSISGALRNASATEATIVAAVELLNASGMIPAEIPR